MWRYIVDFIFNFLQNISNVVAFLNRPLFTTYEDIPLGWLILQKLGLDISWLYQLTPLMMLSSSLVTALTFFLTIKLLGLILDAIPIFGG